MVINQQRANRDSRSERDYRRGPAWSRSDIDHGRIVLRHIDDLRTRRLDHVNGLARRRLLHLYLHFRIAAQGARGVGLCTQPLHRGTDGGLIRSESRTDCGVIVHVLRHHVNHLRESNECYEGGIKPLGLRAIGQRSAGEVRIGLQPVINVQDFLRIGRGRSDLCQQRIRIKSDGR